MKKRKRSTKTAVPGRNSNRGKKKKKGIKDFVDKMHCKMRDEIVKVPYAYGLRTILNNAS